MILQSVPGGVHQRNGVVSGDLTDEFRHGWRLPQFCGITAAELFPTPRHIFVIPPSQSGRRGYLLRPQVVAEILFPHSAGPQPVDEHPETVVRFRFFISAFDLDSCHFFGLTDRIRNPPARNAPKPNLRTPDRKVSRRSDKYPANNTSEGPI